MFTKANRITRTMLCLLACALVCATACCATAEGDVQYAYLRNDAPQDFLRVYAQPSETSEVLGHFLDGVTVELHALGDPEGFSQVRIGDVSGYVRTALVVAQRPALAAAQFATVNSPSLTDTLPLLSAPEADAAVLGALENGTVVEILEETADAYRVRAYAQTGFILQKQSLQLDGQGTMAPLTHISWAWVPFGTSTHLRAFPDAAAPNLGEVLQMGMLEVVGQAGVWYLVDVYPGYYGDHVRSGGGAVARGPDAPQYGFILGRDLCLGNYDVANHRETPGTFAFVVNAWRGDRLPLREAPAQDAAVLGEYLNNTQVQVLEDSYAQEEHPYWLHVRVDGQEGYMQALFLRLIGKDQPGNG